MPCDAHVDLDRLAPEPVGIHSLPSEAIQLSWDDLMSVKKATSPVLQGIGTPLLLRRTG